MSVSVIENGIENGVRWVSLSGIDSGTGIEFDGDVFGIDGRRVLDCDGSPLTDGDHEVIAVKNSARISANERKAKERERKRASGLVKLELWLTPDQVKAVREYAQGIKEAGV